MIKSFPVTIERSIDTLTVNLLDEIIIMAIECLCAKCRPVHWSVIFYQIISYKNRDYYPTVFISIYCGIRILYVRRYHNYIIISHLLLNTTYYRLWAYALYVHEAMAEIIRNSTPKANDYQARASHHHHHHHHQYVPNIISPSPLRNSVASRPMPYTETVDTPGCLQPDETSRRKSLPSIRVGSRFPCLPHWTALHLRLPTHCPAPSVLLSLPVQPVYLLYERQCPSWFKLLFSIGYDGHVWNLFQNYPSFFYPGVFYAIFLAPSPNLPYF